MSDRGTGELRLERVPIEEYLESCPIETVYQSADWLDYLRVHLGVTPVAAAVVSHGRRAGWFVGCVARRFGVKALGSPLRGWGTGPMGFCLSEAVDNEALLAALRRFAFSELGCIHLEVLDQTLRAPVGDPRWSTSKLVGWEFDLTKDEDELRASLSKSTRWSLRRTAREGLRFSVADVGSGSSRARFAGEFHACVHEVFFRHDLPDPYDLRRVTGLVDAMAGAGRLAAFTVTDRDDRVLAASIYLTDGTALRSWGTASRTSSLHRRPNELLMWGAIVHGKATGHVRCVLGGGEYKGKYGGAPYEIDWLRTSRFGVVADLRSALGRSRRLASLLGATRRRSAGGRGRRTVRNARARR
jgi:hypothetical protein